MRDFHSVVLFLTISRVELPEFLFFFFSLFFGQRFMNRGKVLSTQDLRPALEAKACAIRDFLSKSRLCAIPSTVAYNINPGLLHLRKGF